MSPEAAPTLQLIFTIYPMARSKNKIHDKNGNICYQHIKKSSMNRNMQTAGCVIHQQTRKLINDGAAI